MYKNPNFKWRKIVSLCLFFTIQVNGQDTQFTSIQTELFSTPGSLSNAWADYDKDGDLDLLVSIKGGELRLYQNSEGTFVSVGKKLGLPTSGDEIWGVSWGDFDNDGDLDILAGSNVSPIPSRSYLYRNDNAKQFVEVAESVGLTTLGRFSRQANWIDYDNDGDSDLYAANRTGRNQLLKNTNGSFKRLGISSGVEDVRRTVGACWFDMDNDGDLDAFLANQAGDSDTFARNDIDHFEDVAPELGMDQTLRNVQQGGVGCAVGDYNNDGFLDLFVATYGENLLYKNNGNGHFEEVATSLGLSMPDHAVGAAWGDYDNDGYLDLLVLGSKKVEGVSQPQGFLYKNTGTGFVVEKRYPELISKGDHGVEWIDYDNDGDLDLSMTDTFGNEGGHFVFKNELNKDARTRGLAVLVLDSQGNYTQQGAVVRFFDAQGTILGSRIVPTGGGYNAQSARPIYFALSKLQPVKIEVSFMGAEKQSVNITDFTKLKNKPHIIFRRLAPS